MSEWFPQGTQRGHEKPLLQQADGWTAAGTDAAAFQDSSSFFTPATYGTEGGPSPAGLSTAGLPSAVDLAAGGIPVPPDLSSQQLPPQAYFAVPVDTSVEAYPYHPDYGSIASGNTAAAAPVAGGYCPDTWLGMNSGPRVAVVGAAAMPTQSQSFQTVGMSQHPAADAVGYESIASPPSPMSSANSSMMQSPWGSQWDAEPGLVAAGYTTSMSSMASPTAIGQSAGASAVSPAPHADAHGFPADRASSQSGRRSSSITSRPSAHQSPSLEYQQHQVIGQPTGYLPAYGSATVDCFSPGSHATTVGRSPSLGLSQGSRAYDSDSPAPCHQAPPPSLPPACGLGALGLPTGSHGDFGMPSRHPSHEEATPSSATPSIEIEFPTGTDLKKEDLRRRNRKAASKCRAKSKDEETRLRENAWIATETWTELSAETARLQKEVRGLKRELHRHADCGNDLILEYLQSARPPSEDDDYERGAAGGEVAKQASL